MPHNDVVLQVSGLKKRYGSTVAVAGLDLTASRFQYDCHEFSHEIRGTLDDRTAGP